MRVYKSRVPLSILVEEFKREGGIIEIAPDGAIVKAPCGGYIVLFAPPDEVGVLYCFQYQEQERDKLIRFAQRAFARANLTMKNILAQEQVLEPEYKEERKKDTSEVSESVMGASDSVHGGDSASGEVPEAESGRGQDNSSSELPALPQEQEAGSGQEEESASSQPRRLSPDGGSSSAQGEDEGRESCLTDSSSSEAPSSFGDEEGAGESCASDSSEPKRASEEAGSPEDGACPKSSGCSALSQDEGGDASMDGQASIEEGTGSHAPEPSEDPSLEDILNDILSEEDTSQEGKGSGESSTLPSPGGAIEGEASEPEREVSPLLSFKELKKIMSRGFATTPSTRSNSSFGGVFGKLELIKDPPPQSLVNRTRRVFARLVSSYGEGVEGPRWDRKKISTRIASYQNWKVSDRRKETGMPAIAVFSDISGSMDLFAEEVLKVAKILMRIGVLGCEVISICHSNGYPLELWCNGRKVEELSYNDLDDDYAIDWYKRVFAKFDVRVVVLAADWDGAWLYKKLAEEFSIDKVYWLDVYKVACAKGPVVREFPPSWGRFEWSSEALRKIEYVCNCQDAEDFVRGLELMIAKKKLVKLL